MSRRLSGETGPRPLPQGGEGKARDTGILPCFSAFVGISLSHAIA